MKTVTKNRGGSVITDKKLDKYDNVVLFPEKVEKAKEMLRTIGLPKELAAKK